MAIKGFSNFVPANLALCQSRPPKCRVPSRYLRHLGFIFFDAALWNTAKLVILDIGLFADPHIMAVLEGKVTLPQKLTAL